MKKISAFLLLLSIILSFVGCSVSKDHSGSNDANIISENSDNSSGSTDQSPSSKETSWFYPTQVDEFGDTVDTGKSMIKSVSFGDFSNTATTNSDLMVGIVFFVADDGTRTFTFQLSEYNKTSATYTSYSDMSMKVKFPSGSTSEYSVKGTAPNGDIYIDNNDYSTELFEALYAGKDVKSIIYIDNSKYNFTISSNGFKEICQEVSTKLKEKAENERERNRTKDIESLVNNIQKRSGDEYLLDAYKYLEENRESFAPLSDSEIKKVLEGDFFCCTLSLSNEIVMSWSYIMNYKQKEEKSFVRTQTYYYKYEIKLNPEKTNFAKECSYSNGLIKDSTATEEIREICNGYYVIFKQDRETQEYTIPYSFLMKVNPVSDDGSFTAMYDITD